ncbi:hypothetical protein CYMTET_46772 [Cymbomonas tetramitiformis]|uniref:Uncharacterized protein n=1 Tax=Cymbomonas tetramitiformis TaxID=36881 RepID=A0AAE0BVM9_9CHLO|nr:hypothetical protein CYMTET_46772 [Cymbomonas tetramitiformis]
MAAGWRVARISGVGRGHDWVDGGGTLALGNGSRSRAWGEWSLELMAAEVGGWIGSRAWGEGHWVNERRAACLAGGSDLGRGARVIELMALLMTLVVVENHRMDMLFKHDGSN